MTNETETPTSGTSQSISDIIDAIKREDKDGLIYHAGFLEEVDPFEILDRVAEVLSTMQYIAASSPGAVEALGDAKHGADALFMVGVS